MPVSRRQIDELTGAIFMIGLGCLFYFGFWPGILFLLGGISLVRALSHSGYRGEFECAGTLIGLGIWATMGFNIGALFIIAGAGMIVSWALRNVLGFRGHSSTAKPKPDADSYLD